jgi:hypothetical protein
MVLQDTIASWTVMADQGVNADRDWEEWAKDSLACAGRFGVRCRLLVSRCAWAMRIGQLIATCDCLLIASSPRFAVAFCAGTEPFGAA